MFGGVLGAGFASQVAALAVDAGKAAVVEQGVVSAVAALAALAHRLAIGVHVVDQFAAAVLFAGVVILVNNLAIEVEGEVSHFFPRHAMPSPRPCPVFGFAASGFGRR